MTEKNQDSERAGGTAASVASVGLAVKAERSRRGMTRRALAYHASISERYLADMERGQANVSLAVLFSVARALGMPAWSLMPDAPGAQDTVGPVPVPGVCGVALVGLRGGGKTTLGQALADKTGTPFLRLGQVIEELGGMEQGELISLAGQRAYRRLERDAVNAIIDRGSRVILETGGSLVSESETYELLLNNFFTVWVRATPEDHMQRVIDQGDMRPIAGNRAAMNDLQTILSERERDYRRAHAALSTSARSVDDCISEIAGLTDEFLG